MDPTLLSPTPSGPDLPGPKLSQNPPDSIDGFKYNWTPRNPGSEPTRPKESSHPPPVDLQEPLLDLAANATYDDQDRVFVQASPHIFQRQQGGWNAKLPEVDLGDRQSTSTPIQVSSEYNRGEGHSLIPKEGKGVSRYMTFKLTWTIRRTLNKRRFTFSIIDTNKPSQEAKTQDTNAQALKPQNGKAKNCETQKGEAQNGGIPEIGTQNGEGLGSKDSGVLGSNTHKECYELEVSRRVLWK
ncbi:MAG: hypothetical protein Q9217_001690 [Psora testacea]